MESAKNYLMLIIISILFIFFSVFIIREYAETKVEDEVNIFENSIPEIKIANLDDYLLETPDLIFILSDKDGSETIGEELVKILSEQNLLTETVYMDKADLEDSDWNIINNIFKVDIEKAKEKDILILVHDFEVTDSISISDADNVSDRIEIFLERNKYSND